ncbi:sushi, von Willebrand factor type A, EGF and pentraxin domain-containing protein 1 isoform X1 [Nematostella vectensis]|uniref:sushi, von Willebrand factor type A, EGF and pentraxin domain-containing protein 1 isoform X1 n=1 Tax=Nematostella vectensis TaxID=45351 RepID=UPI00138FE883|nr:sushi, von Willebrand factor type A, EGF and pentraxin domain-containing protein 1 isoform X1 [Nematostella vectensis]
MVSKRLLLLAFLFAFFPYLKYILTQEYCRHLVFDAEENDQTVFSSDWLVKSLAVQSSGSCQQHCFLHPDCTAYTFCPEGGGGGACSLLGSNDNLTLTGKKGCTFQKAQNNCENRQCLHNNMTCQTGFGELGFRCVCPLCFHGEDCEEVSLGKQVLEFPEPNSTNRLEYFNEKPRQIYNITVCLWFQASKQSTESSTVFSLATNQSDNAFTVFLDKTNRKIALYLQTGKPVSSIDDDVFDSHWHHYCASWTDSTNAWKTYLNGTLKDHGEKALSMEDSLQCPLHDGSIVLGADQDGYQSKFKEPFLGNMTAVNIWDRELTDTEIADLAKECPSGIGNFLSWEGFLMKFSDKTRMICPVECTPYDSGLCE